MNHGRTFLIISAAILVLAIINLSVGPLINHKVEDENWPWSLQNCGKISDDIDELKEKNTDIDTIKKLERKLTKCRHEKPMHSLEEISFVTNVIIGMVCLLFSSFGLEKELKTKIGIAGIILGVIGFILTFLYVIYNGIVYTNYYDVDDIMKVDGDSAFAEMDSSKYKCFYFKEKGDVEALVAKYSDLIKSQYNYNKDLIDIFDEDHSEQKNCIYDPEICSENEYIDGPIYYRDESGRVCQKLYFNNDIENYKNFDKSSRFLVCLIFSLLTLLCHCCLAFCGFILFKEP